MSVKDFLILPFLILIIVLSAIYAPLLSSWWGLISLIFLILVIFQLFLYYERKVTGSKEVATISVLGAFSAASRIPFAAIPSVQPCTFLILITGYVFGPAAGFMVGAETALLSNFFLGQGPWTPWQMVAWGLIGVLGWFFRKIAEGRKYEYYLFLILGIIAGYLYGIIMNISYWLLYMEPHTVAGFLYVESLSFWFDTLHAAGNVIFIDLFSTRAIKILKSFKLRFGLFNKNEAPSAS